MRPTLADYWLDIYSRKRIVLMVTGASAGIALAASLLMTPLYESKTVMYAPGNVVVPDYTGQGPTVALGQQPYIPVADEKSASIGIGILRSRDVFEAVHKAFPDRSVNDLMGQTDIKVSREFMLEVYVRDPDPATATAIARRYPDLYRGFNAENIRQQMLRVQDSALRQADAVERKMSDLRRIARQAPPGGVAAAAQALEAAQAKAAKAAAALDPAKIAAVDAVFDAGNEPIVRQVERVALEPAASRQAARVTLDDILTRLTAPMAGNDAALGSKLAGYATARADVAIAAAQAKTAPVADTGSRTASAWDGTSDTDLQQTVTRLRSVAAEAAAQANEPSTPVVVVQEASSPTRPVFPIVPLNVAVAAITGLALGCYYALFCGMIERVRLQRIQRGMERPMLASADLNMLRNVRERRS